MLSRTTEPVVSRTTEPVVSRTTEPVVSRATEPGAARPRLTDMNRSRRHSRGRSYNQTRCALIGIAVAVGLLGTACGIRPAPGLSLRSYTAPSRTDAASRTDVASRGGPPQGSRAASVALARKMLREVRRPPGSRTVRPDPVPQYLREPFERIGATHWVDLRHFYAAPRSMRASYAYLRQHVPAGYQLMSSGGEGSGGTTVLEFVVYTPKALPRGIDEADLVVGVVPGRHAGRSVLRADGEVAWFPPRSAAEWLHPARYRAVTITRTVLSSKRKKVRTFRSRAAIARLALVLNSLPASDGGSVSCPAESLSYRLVFRPGAGRPQFAVTTAGCGTDSVTVAGRAQPDLADPGGRLAGAARLLLSGGGH